MHRSVAQETSTSWFQFPIVSFIKTSTAINKSRILTTIYAALLTLINYGGLLPPALKQNTGLNLIHKVIKGFLAKEHVSIDEIPHVTANVSLSLVFKKINTHP